jgi:hypothetical protein
VWCEFPPEDLSALVDGELPDGRAREAQAHLGVCASCRAEIERLRRADDAVRQGRVAAVPLSFRDRVAEAALLRDRRLPLRRFGVPAAVAAAALLLALRPELVLRREGTLSAGDPVARQAALLDSLELDAASLRLLLAAEQADATAGSRLAARIDAVLGRVRELRREGLPAARQGG